MMGEMCFSKSDVKLERTFANSALTLAKSWVLAHICKNCAEPRSGSFTETSSTKVTLHDVAYLFGEWERTKDENNPTQIH